LNLFLHSTALHIRLINGTNETEGRVEIWHHQWSTICDDGWDDNDAFVVCKQLGHSGGSARGGAYFGQGTGSILFDNVSCYGNESSIYSCNQGSFKANDCNHHQDAGVICYGNPIPGIPYMLAVLYWGYCSIKLSLLFMCRKQISSCSF